jgi:hypothetical protein
MATVTSKNREEFNAAEMAKKGKQEDNPYYVKKTSITNNLFGSEKNPKTKVFYDVEHKSHGHYSRLKSEPHAHIVAYGLNKKYPEHSLGGFSDNVAEKIRNDMTSENHPMVKHPDFHNDLKS